jgi:hypothetical protein
MKICPIKAANDIISKSFTNSGWYNMYSTSSLSWFMAMRWINEKIAHHLLIFMSIYMGEGLNLSLISAWKSGMNPSAKRLIVKRKSPKNSVDRSESMLDAGSNTLNIMIPMVTIVAIIIFWELNFNSLVLTLEQQSPTKITLIRLHDLAMIIKG